MSCKFSIPFSAPAEQVLDKAKTAIQNQGGNFTGDQSSGSFDVSVFGNNIEGTYSISGNFLNINIDSKPFLVPCSVIESYLKNKIG